VYAARAEVLQGQPDVAAVAARYLGGRYFESFIRVTIAICLLTSVFSMMMAAPRVYAKMADDGLLPQQLRFQGDRPAAATLVQMLVASLLVWISDLQGLLSYLGLTLSICAACSACCLFLPAVRRRPLFHPLHLVPAIYIACTLAAAGIMVSIEPMQLLGTILTFAAGVAAYPLAHGVPRKD
jgi:APA family basic amino acid/polyamine antiporter